MANVNFTPVPKGDCHYTATAAPINTLTSDPRILNLAASLYEQGKRMADAQQQGIAFEYHPICIPRDLRKIFG